MKYRTYKRYILVDKRGTGYCVEGILDAPVEIFKAIGGFMPTFFGKAEALITLQNIEDGDIHFVWVAEKTDLHVELVVVNVWRTKEKKCSRS